MFRTRFATIIAGVLITALYAEMADAQLFGGGRSGRLGRPLSRQDTPGLDESLEDVGTLRGNERFLRQNRSRADFVGPDVRELERFIGLLQARIQGDVPLATEGVRRRVDRSDQVNQPLTPNAGGRMYHPRMEVSFESPRLMPTPLETSALDTLVRSPDLAGPSRIEVSVADRIATLRGEVPSPEDRELASTLLMFQPGISEVQNELEVNPELTAGPNSLQMLRDRREPQEAWTTLSQGSTERTGEARWIETTSESPRPDQSGN